MKTHISNYVRAFSFMAILAINGNCTNQSGSKAAPAPDRDKQTSKIQIALLLDTSNSMDGLIDQAKSQLWTIVNELAKARCGNDRPVLQIALYEYGNDGLPASEGYIRLVTPLTSDLDQISKDLFELTTNGGDEFCGQVIETALKRLDWSVSSNDMQLIFIAGNEPFTQGNVSYVQACELAKSKHVIVNTIFCGNFNEGIKTSWKRGADLTGGTYASIEQNRKTVYIPSPYDRRISELNQKLNNTYVPYGAYGSAKKANQVAQDENAQSVSEGTSVKRAVAKSSAAYKNDSWDLVDASKQSGFSVDNVAEEALPAEMKGMSDAEKTSYIKEKSEEREKISQEIQELNKKRKVYVTQQQAQDNSDNMLDAAMLNAIRQQLKAKNFTIEDL